MNMVRSVAVGLLLASPVTSAAPALAATPSDCDTLRHHGHRVEAQACYQSLTLSADPYLRAEGFWRLETSDGDRLVRIAYTTGGVARRGPVTLRPRDLEHLRAKLGDASPLAAALGWGGGEA